MKEREKYKLNWAALLLAAALAVGIAPAWAEETDTAELAVSVSGQTVAFTLYAEEFDAAGFCVSGAVNAAAAEGFTAVTCRQSGGTLELVVRAEQPVAAIHNASSSGAVAEKLAAAMARADEIAAESGLDFPRLLTLEGAEPGGNGALRDIYPAFVPETTTYLFCSATSQTRGSSIDDIHVCDADGREKDGTIGEITAKGTVLQLITYEQDGAHRLCRHGQRQHGVLYRAAGGQRKDPGVYRRGGQREHRALYGL